MPAAVIESKRSLSSGGRPGKMRTLLRSITPNRRREKLECEFFEEDTQLDDGELPSLKKVPSELRNDDDDNDFNDDLKSVISRASSRRLSPNSRKRHSAFWNQLDQSGSLSDEAPDDEASHHHDMLRYEQQQQQQQQRAKQQQLEAERARQRSRGRSRSRSRPNLEKEQVEYLSDEEDGLGPVMAMMTTLCGDCFDNKPDKVPKKIQNVPSRRSKTDAGLSMAGLEMMAMSSQDDESEYGLYENTAIEVEFIEPPNKRSYGNETLPKKQEAFLQLGDTGNVSLMVKKEKKDVIDSEVHVENFKTPEPKTVPLTHNMSDLSDDTSRHVLSSVQKDDLLNHLINEAKEEFEQQKKGDQTSVSEESDDISAILNDWRDQAQEEVKKKHEKDASNRGEKTESKDIPNKAERTDNIPSEQTSDLSRGLTSLAIQSDLTRGDISKKNVGEIDKEAVQNKIASGQVNPRMSQLDAPSSPVRSTTSSTNKMHLPKIKLVPTLSSKGFKPVFDDDDSNDKEENNTKNLNHTKSNVAHRSQEEKSSSKDTKKVDKVNKVEQFRSPPGVNKTPSSTDAHTLRRIKSLNAVENPLGRPSSLSRSQSTVKAKSSKSLWGSRKKHDKKSKKTWHAMDDDSEEDIFEEEKSPKSQPLFSHTTQETSHSVQKTENNTVLERGFDSVRDDEKKQIESNHDDISSFTDDKTVTTNNIIRSVKLKTPRNLTGDFNDELIDTTHANDDAKSTISTGTGLSLGSTWSSASTTTSTRRRHRGAGKNRKASSEINTTSGWYKSIQAAAQKNQRAWDAERGWIDYVEPDTQISADKSHIGSLSIKQLSTKKKPEVEVNNVQVSNPSPIASQIKSERQINIDATIMNPKTVNSQVRSERQTNKDENTGNATAVHSQVRSERQVNKEVSTTNLMPMNSQVRSERQMNKDVNIVAPSTPPKKSSDYIDGQHIDNESLAQASLSPLSDYTRQTHSPVQFLPAKEASVANASKTHFSQEQWFSNATSNDDSNKPLHTETYPPPSKQDKQAGAKSSAGKVATTTIEQFDTVSRELPMVTDSDDDSDAKDGSSDDDKSNESDRQDENVYQELYETVSDDESDLPLGNEGRNDETSITSGEKSMNSDETSLLEESNVERNMLYNWLDNGEIQIGENETDLDFGMGQQLHNIQETKQKEEKLKVIKPNISKISDQDDNINEFPVADFDDASFGDSKEEFEVNDSPSDSDESEPSAYDNNGFKIIKSPQKVDWGKSQPTASIADPPGDTRGVVASLELDTSGDYFALKKFSDSEDEKKSNSDIMSAHDEESSMMSDDDQKSVKTFDSRAESVNSVSSRAKAWVELMESKKSKLDSLNETQETETTTSLENKGRHLSVEEKKFENPPHENLNRRHTESEGKDSTSKNLTDSEKPTNQGSNDTKNNAEKSLQNKNEKSNDVKGQHTMMFVSAADEDSVFKFAQRSPNADDDTIFSNLDEKNGSPNKLSRANMQKNFTRDDKFGQSGNVDIPNTRRDLLSMTSDSFDENTLNTRSTIDRYGTGFEINSSFQDEVNETESDAPPSNFFSRIASACDPMMPNALQCSAGQTKMDREATQNKLTQEVPLAHLAFLQEQQRSSPNNAPPSRSATGFDSKVNFFNKKERTKSPPVRNSFGKSEENGHPHSKRPSPTERKSDIGLSPSYLEAMAKFSQGGNKSQTRSHVSTRSNGSKSEAWKGFMERRSQSGLHPSDKSNLSEQNAAKRVEKMMMSLSKSKTNGKKEVQNALDSMGSPSKKNFYSPATMTGRSNRGSRKNLAAAEARVEAMMAAMSNNDLEEAEI